MAAIDFSTVELENSGSLFSSCFDFFRYLGDKHLHPSNEYLWW